VNDYIELLRELISIETASPLTDKSIEEANKFLSRFNIKKTQNNLFHRGSPDSKIWVYSHIDTKPPLPFEEWAYDPYEMVYSDGKYYGLGISDSKFQLLNAILLANDDFYLLIDTDEENNGMAAGELMSHYLIETLVIIDGTTGNDPFRFYNGLYGQMDGTIKINSGLIPVHPSKRSESKFLRTFIDLIGYITTCDFQFNITGINSPETIRSLTTETADLRFDIRYQAHQKTLLDTFLKETNAIIRQHMPPLSGRVIHAPDAHYSKKSVTFSCNLGRSTQHINKIIVAPGGVSENGNHRPNEFIFDWQIKEHQRNIKSLFQQLQDEQNDII